MNRPQVIASANATSVVQPCHGYALNTMVTNFPIIFLLFFSLTCLKSCKLSDEKNHSSNLSISIKVGLFGGSNDSGEMMFDGDQTLEYIVNDEFIGEGDSGANHLHAYLQKTKKASVTIQNPGTSFIGGLCHRPGLRDEAYKYPYIKNAKLRADIILELDRIRGWSDATEPIWKPDDFE